MVTRRIGIFSIYDNMKNIKKYNMKYEIQYDNMTKKTDKFFLHYIF